MYVVAIPSYDRARSLVKKSLTTLKNGKVERSQIYIFVANKSEEQIYRDVIPHNLYNKIVVGKLGIANQRIFIKNYFSEGQEVVSIDDDVEHIFRLNGEKISKISNIDSFFKNAFERLHKEKLFLWGIYPIGNTFYMQGKQKVTTSLRFIIGVLHGYIVRNNKDLEPSPSAEGKEDYEQSILYFKNDGGVLRFNNIGAKTQFFAPGGLGNIKKRIVSSKKAANYLEKKYPNMVTKYHRDNGMSEVRLKNIARMERTSKSTKKHRKASNRSKTKKHKK
tara:strand:- start:654 stop:1484 length:831 start_codon:yes stop_codon:yes gene_type:complete